MWFNSLIGKSRTAGPERKTGYSTGASLQVPCVDGKLSLLDSEIWTECQDQVTISWQLRPPSVPLTIFLNQCFCKCESNDPMFLSGKSMKFLFSFEPRFHGM